MALFTDGPVNKMIDLQKYENAILDVTATESIDLDGKIALAQSELATELTLFLLQVSAAGFFNDDPAHHWSK